MEDIFQIRNGITDKPLISNDFPKSARIGLNFIIKNLVNLGYIKTGYGDFVYQYINEEIHRLARDLNAYQNDELTSVIYNLSWDKVFQLMERIFSNLLIAKESYSMDEPDIPIEIVKEYYKKEINNLLLEENIDFYFDNGIFLRKGYLKTQQSIRNTMVVLSDPLLLDAKKHYLKSLKYFRSIENPDYENTIKESVCSLESALLALGVKGIEKNFENALRAISGNQDRKIPAPIVESIIKIFGYRNCGNGVAHGNSAGVKVSEKEAELMLSLCGDYVTYFYSLLKTINDENLF